MIDPDALGPAPEDCTSMDDVREGVDAVDRALVRLLVRRQGFMEAAARIKPEESEVVVPWRIEQVVENVLLEASKSGLSPRIAEPVWRCLIDKSIDHERETWRRIHENGSDIS